MCFYWWLYCGCGAVETGATETRWYIYYMQCLVLVHSNAHTRSYSRFGWKHARSWKRITQQVSRIISSWVWETKKLLELLLRRMQFFFREVSPEFSGVMRLLSYIRAEIPGTYNNLYIWPWKREVALYSRLFFLQCHKKDGNRVDLPIYLRQTQTAQLNVP
jgi:hypothetical protein